MWLHNSKRVLPPQLICPVAESAGKDALAAFAQGPHCTVANFERAFFSKRLQDASGVFLYISSSLWHARPRSDSMKDATSNVRHQQLESSNDLAFAK